VSGGPLQFQEQHLIIAHPACSPEDSFDRRVDRLDDTKADRMIAVGGDALEVTEEEVAESLHFREALPAQRLDPAQAENSRRLGVSCRSTGDRVAPQHVRFEQTSIRREQCLKLLALGPTDGPPPEQQPAFSAAMLAHHRASPKEFLAAQLVERRASVLQDVEFVEHDLRLWQHSPTALR
jgi:hypothetical protein